MSTSAWSAETTPVGWSERKKRDFSFNLVVAAGAAAKKLNLKSTDRGIDGAKVNFRIEKQKVEGSKKKNGFRQ